MKKQAIIVITVVLVLSLLMGHVSIILPVGNLVRVEAAPSAQNLIVGLFKFMAALEQRNRVYGEARVTAADVNAHYDQLLAQSEKLRQENVKRAIAGETHVRLARSYTRIIVALEAERKAASDMIEAEKGAARQEFMRRLGRQIRGILIASPGGQKVLTEVREALGDIREAAVAVQMAAEAGKPTVMLGEALAGKVGGMGVVKDAARELGSMAGQQIDKGLGGMLSQIEGVIGNIQTEVGSVIDWVDDMDVEIARQQALSREPVSLVGNRSHTDMLIPVDRAEAVLDIAANAFARAAEQSGNLEPGISRDTMAGRIKADLLDARLAGIEILISGNLSGRVYCKGVGVGEYELAAKQLGQVPQVSPNPERARYVVCYDLETGAPQLAKLFGALTDEERAAIGQDPADAGQGIDVPEGPIPVGTYEGQTGYADIFIDYDFNEDQVVIQIANDGSVSGSFSVDMISPQYHQDTCFSQFRSAWDGSFHGQLSGSEGTIELTTTPVICQYMGTCDGSTECYSNISKVSIKVVGIEMEGEILFTEPEDPSITMVVYFKAIKQ